MTISTVDTLAAPHLSLIVPVYNGADRLPTSLEELRVFLRAQPYSWELILVDDCSNAETRAILEQFATSMPEVRLIRNEENRGKGSSVTRGMRAAVGKFRVFTDADLAYPATEVGKILADLEGGADVAIACRVLAESRYLMSPTFFSYLYTRHVMSRVFNAMVRWTLIPRVLDTQAGLKGFTAHAAEIVFPRITIPRFGFDVEALFIAKKHGLSLAQTAVFFRYDEEPTTVRFAEDVLRMMRDLLHIRRNDWRGRYA
ncbi:MAG: putative glycosyltransferase [Gemmatimonadetes bacterium]|jgi:dolichyl-phosphate beta-glucosyltransferase|nr:putative glycosyltransferase [Gemmatimonadota bacterium]